jgi:hypothetical protein
MLGVVPFGYPTKSQRKCPGNAMLFIEKRIRENGLPFLKSKTPRTSINLLHCIIMFVQPIFSILLASALALTFFTGCPAPSEWDHQWEAIQDRIRAGDLAQAQTQLQAILPSIRKKGPSDKRYAQIIYQLGDIARLEGDNNQAESYYWEALPLIAQSLGPEHLPSIRKKINRRLPCPCSNEPWPFKKKRGAHLTENYSQHSNSIMSC